ncbi:hypothetical protein ACFL3T_01365 [Patescibacteria group bacterium]
MTKKPDERFSVLAAIDPELLRAYARAEAATPGNTKAFPPGTTMEEALAVLEGKAVEELKALKRLMDEAEGAHKIQALERLIEAATTRFVAKQEIFEQAGFESGMAELLVKVVQNEAGFPELVEAMNK